MKEVEAEINSAIKSKTFSVSGSVTSKRSSIYLSSSKSLKTRRTLKEKLKMVERMDGCEFLERNKSASVTEQKLIIGEEVLKLGAKAKTLE